MLPDGTIESLIQAHTNLSANAGKGEKVAKILFTGVEVGFGAALMGGINGRFCSPGEDHLKVLGAPVDITLGIIAIGASLFGVFGKDYDAHVAAIGSGMVGAFIYRKVMEKASDARVEAEVGRAMMAEGSANRRVSNNSTADHKKVVQLVTK